MGHRPNSYVPHWMVRTDDGYYHFRVTKDLLPWPLCYLIFRGEFEYVAKEDFAMYYSYKVKNHELSNSGHRPEADLQEGG